ncbi:MAG: hypothetical protein PWP40_2737 [Rhodocyclaceae bacterium]|nr:hypothetical protein [Rhodocyclaceae bacterium]
MYRRLDDTLRCPSLPGTRRISSPATLMRPASGCSRKLMQRRKVLLPEPDEPMMVMTSPASADSDTPFSTSWSP